MRSPPWWAPSWARPTSSRPRSTPASVRRWQPRLRRRRAGTRSPVGKVGHMFAVYAEKFSSDDPLSGLVLGERPDPVAPDGWTTITVTACLLYTSDAADDLLCVALGG